MENIFLVTCKYICFMSTLPDYTEYQLKESEMVIRQLYPPVYNPSKGIRWIPQKLPEIQRYLLTGNIYLMGGAALEALSSREVSFESEDTELEVSEMQEAGDHISDDCQLQEKEEDSFNPITSSKGLHTIKGTTSGTQSSTKGK